WAASDADIMSYMDVDLSTGIEAFPPLIKAIAENGYGVSTGTRLARKSKVDRSIKRTTLSRGYNFIIKAMLFTRFSDAQCGFKAISREVAQKVLPLIQDNNWFFDTELLVLAEKMGYRIKDIPVRWVEDKDTRVKIGSTISEDLRGLWRMRRERPWRQKP
ncbi:MAG: glycosyltransferase, partial [Chloroflexota bacterium]